MKKIKRITAILLSAVMLCPSLSVSADLMENERTDISYSDIQYQKFDDSKLKSAADELKEIAEKNTKGKEQRIEELINILYDEYDLQATMYNIRYNEFYHDVTNEKIQNELPELEQNYYDYYDVIFSALYEIYNSDYQDLIFDLLDQDLIHAVAYYEEMDETYAELSGQETELVLEYESLYSQGFSVDYKGQTWTAEDLKNDPPESIDEYNRISNMIYSKMNSELGEIYLKLLKIRDKIAKLYGYPDYAQYAYETTYIRDYSLDDIEKVYVEVKKSFPDLNNSLCNQLGLSLYTTGLSNQQYTGEEVLDTIEPYFSEIDSQIAENFNYMREHHLYDIESSPDKMEGGYTVLLNSYAVPFIFNCPYGDYNDIRTMIHEFGHANADYIHPTRAISETLGISLDTLEIHSQGMEVLFTEYHDDIFGETQGKVFTDYTIYAMISAVIDGCLFDEFQRYAYENPDCTLEQLNEKYKELNEEYGMEYSTDIVYSYDWTQIAHNFNSPMYYISYATSALSSLDLWAEAAKDRDNAIEIYKDLIDCGGSTPYTEAVKQCGLRDIFESGVVSDIAADTEYILENGTLQTDTGTEESSEETTEITEEVTATASTSLEKARVNTSAGMAIPMIITLIVAVFIAAIFFIVIVLIAALIIHHKNKKQK